MRIGVAQSHKDTQTQARYLITRRFYTLQHTHTPDLGLAGSDQTATPPPRALCSPTPCSNSLLPLIDKDTDATQLGSGALDQLLPFNNFSTLTGTAAVRWSPLSTVGAAPRAGTWAMRSENTRQHIAATRAFWATTMLPRTITGHTQRPFVPAPRTRTCLSLRG